MLSIFRTVLRLGRATVDYPRVQPPVPSRLKGLPILNDQRCVASGDCVQACPAQAITLEIHGAMAHWTLDLARCVFCGRCAEVCQQSAIEITNAFELAALQRNDLLMEHRFAPVQLSRPGGANG